MLKARVAFHKSCMILSQLEKTPELSTEVCRLNRAGLEFVAKWEINEKAPKPKPGCLCYKLCLAEMHSLLLKKNCNTLNALKMAKCVHKKKAMPGSVLQPR